MPRSVKYYSTGPDVPEVARLARLDGLAVTVGSPAFCIWSCIKMIGPRRLIDAALERLRGAGVRFERRKPRGAFEVPDPVVTSGGVPLKQ